MFKTGTCYWEKLSVQELEVFCVLLEWVQRCLFEVFTNVL